VNVGAIHPPDGAPGAPGVPDPLVGETPISSHGALPKEETSGELIPASIEAQSGPFKRAGVAFANRFFFLLLAGLIWLVPAFADHRFVWALLAWDVLVLLIWLLDLNRLPKPAQFKVRRTWLAPPALSVESSVRLKLINASNSTVHARLMDDLPQQLRHEPAQVEITARPRNEAQAQYSILPMTRGRAHLGDVYIRYQSPIRIAERWARIPMAQTVITYPNLEEAKRHSVYLIRSRQIELEKRYTQFRGAGRAFESLREYREGDEFRDICWTASARRGKLVTRLYEIERSQTIWIMLDAGRLMRTRVAGLSKLDYAVNAALTLTQVALYSGDRVGLLAYGRGIRQRVPAARGAAHLMQMMRQLALVQEDQWEGDHLQAASRLLNDQKRRSLVVWITDLAETAMTPEVIEAAARLMPRHLVLFVVIGQPDLNELATERPEDVDQMYQIAAAQAVVHRRELLLARLRERGALAMETSSGKLSTTVVNSYLEIKQRNQL
jgi:uncharacterized protein (DUF58 family)